MSKFKKVLLLCTTYALVAALAIGGTIAYLQDEDSDVNVMTLGNVSIEQHEYERALNEDGTYKTDTIDNRTSYVLQDFTQAKPLLPIVGDPNEPGDSAAYAGYDSIPVRMSQVDSYGGMDVFAGKNAQDKFVTVENTGKTDAYVRTLVAIEVGSTDGKLIKTSYHKTWGVTTVGNITVDENTYLVFEYIYKGGQLSDGSWRHENGILPAGDTSYPNLSQVYLKHNATNEDMIAIDGNGNGTLDILVLSQAVQAAGFDNAKTALDTAFGTAKDYAATWFDGTSIPVIGADAVREALENGGDVLVTGSVNPEETIVASDWGSTPMELYVDADTVDSLTGGTYVLDESAKYGIVVAALKDDSVTLSDMDITADSRWSVTLDNYGGNILLENVSVEATSGAGIWAYSNNTDYSITTLNNVTVNQQGLSAANASTAWANTAVAVSNGQTLVINGGSYVGQTWAVYGYNSGSNITINGGTFKADRVIQMDGVWSGSATSVATINGGDFDGMIYLDWGTNVPELYINGGTFTNFSATVCGQAKLVITGGTFDADPSAYVATGYVATENNGVWTVAAN